MSFVSHEVVGLQYSGSVPHLRVSCHSYDFSRGSFETLRFIRCILVGNGQSGGRLNFESFDGYCKYLWYVNGVDWSDQTARQKSHLRSLRSKSGPRVHGRFVGTLLFPCARTSLLRLPLWLHPSTVVESVSEVARSEVSSTSGKTEHEMVDDSSDGECVFSGEVDE